MSDTYTNLLFHGDGEQDDKVEDEDRPEDGDVKEIEHRTDHADEQRLHCTVPEFNTLTISQRKKI